MTGYRRSYGWLAVAALAVPLVWQVSQMTFGATLVWSLLLLAVFSLAVFAAAVLLARDGCEELRQHAELLVPVALLAVALSLVDAIGLTAPLFTARLGFVSVPVSIAWILRILVSAFFATWTTLLVVDAVHQNRADLAETLRYGIATSWRNRGRWWMLLLVQYLLVGVWATVGLRYNSAGGPAWNRTDFNISVRYHTSWLADYAYDAQWYATLMEWLGNQPIMLVTTVWALLSAVLSIVIKLAIVRRLADEASTHAENLPDEPMLGERMSLQQATNPMSSQPSFLPPSQSAYRKNGASDRAFWAITGQANS